MKQSLIAILLMSLAAAAGATEVAAVLQWSQRVELSLPVSGVVQKVYVNVGDRVKPGQALLALDARSFAAKVAESRAALERLREERAEARRDLERVQELHDRTVIATTELDQAKLRYARAKGMLDEAQARLKIDSQQLEDSVLHAPFDAVVVAREVEPGQAIAAGLNPRTLLVVARAGEMLARFRLYDSQIAQLKMGQAVQVEAGGKTYPGKIHALGLEPVPGKDEALYPVDVRFATTDLLRPGTPVKVKLP